MEAVGAAGDEAYLVVQCLGAALGDAQADGGEDAFAVFFDGLGETDEWGEAAAGCAADEAVDQDGDVVEVESCGEDAPEGLLEGCRRARPRRRRVLSLR